MKREKKVYLKTGHNQIFIGKNLKEACMKYEDYLNMHGVETNEVEHAFKDYCKTKNIDYKKLLDDDFRYNKIRDNWYKRLSGRKLFYLLRDGSYDSYIKK